MREYIYVGDKLLAEYQPQSNQLYYYTTDQVNSVRVVTNQTGVRVFAAAYDPYGGIQKIWENSYSPELKFSGKERDSESNLDYFGARYYANYSYRWLSPDPVVNRDESMRNPQLWNLYSFCRNNPATYWDPDGMLETSLKKLEMVYDKSQFYSFTRFWVSGEIEDNVNVENVGGRYSPRFKYHAKIQITLNRKEQAILDHEKHHAEGYEWLYERNVEQFLMAEARLFESREEAMKFGHRFFQETVKWRPFKWKLHDPSWPFEIPVNILAWFTHMHKWEKWAQNKDWN
jgi:RHS repeat-associated protein